MRRYIIIALFLILSNCNKTPVMNTHGVPFLFERQSEIKVNVSNKNDIIKKLGYPTVKSSYDDNIWFYIERVKTRGKLLNLGKNILMVNNTLVLQFNEYGILTNKKLHDLNKVNNITFVESKSKGIERESNFIYSVLTSLRQKISDPLNKRKKKTK
tara:strand:+ start:361 stop:828 length:468 start_codon:yes stop_codon:yes gene_type:complete